MATTEDSAACSGWPTVVADDAVRDFVVQRGGRLYVWAVAHRCCGGAMTFLEADVTPPARRPPVTPIDGGGFELYFDGGRRGRPQTLELTLERRGHKVRAYWNGCAFVY